MTKLRKIIYNETEIEFYHTIKNVKNINMRVKSDQTVNVSSNNRVSFKKIDDFVIQNAEFILQSREKFKQRELLTTDCFKQGQTFLYLGKKFKINIIESTQNLVQIEQDNLNIYTNETADNNIKTMVQNFINTQCNDIFSKLMEKYLEIFSPLGVKNPNLIIKNLKSKWGSCTPTKNEIMLNQKLIHFDIDCMEYVVLHEYCHFFHQNHSKDFYNFLSQYMPNYKIYKNKLNNKE